MRPIFFHNQSGDDVLRAMQARSRREPAVVLSRTLVQEIRLLAGIAEPFEPTVVLLRFEHRRKRRWVSLRTGRRFAHAFASAVSVGLVASALAAALGCALAFG